jgi:hypothetical protein
MSSHLSELTRQFSCQSKPNGLHTAGLFCISCFDMFYTRFVNGSMELKFIYYYLNILFELFVFYLLLCFWD